VVAPSEDGGSKESRDVVAGDWPAPEFAAAATPPAAVDSSVPEPSPLVRAAAEVPLDGAIVVVAVTGACGSRTTRPGVDEIGDDPPADVSVTVVVVVVAVDSLETMAA
jgi:hypothetical protein